LSHVVDGSRSTHPARFSACPDPHRPAGGAQQLDGTSVSTAVRAALIDAARQRARTTLHAEAQALAADEQDRAEAAQVLRDMETLRAW